MTFTGRSPVWLSRYLWLEMKIKFCVFLTFFITLRVIRKTENEYRYGMVKPVTPRFLLFWGTSWSFWSAIFVGLQYYTISQTLITRRPCISDLTLLNDAFNALRALETLKCSCCTCRPTWSTFCFVQSDVMNKCQTLSVVIITVQ